MALPNNLTTTGFNLQKLWIAPNGGTTTSASNNWTRIPGALRMAATGGTKVVEQYGDGGLMGNWLYDQRATLELETSVLIPQLITALNGSASSGASATPSSFFGSDLSSNPPVVRIKGMAEARRQTLGASFVSADSSFIRYTFFKCQITNDPFPEAAAYGALHTNRYTLIAMPSLYDEYGNSLGGSSFGAGANATFAVARADLGLTQLDND